jgi:hypothetical protein
VRSWFAPPTPFPTKSIVPKPHAIGGSALISALLWAFPNAWFVWFFFLFWLGPGVFCNALFHAGASVVSRTYCPGSITGLVIHLPLTVTLAVLALREQLPTSSGLIAVCVLAPAFHALEVGHNVFKRW